MLRSAPRHHRASLLLDGIVDHAASSANPNLQATLDRYVYSGFKRMSDAMSSPYRHSRAAKRARTRHLVAPTVGKPIHVRSPTWLALTSPGRSANEARYRRRREDFRKTGSQSAPDRFVRRRRVSAPGSADAKAPIAEGHATAGRHHDRARPDPRHERVMIKARRPSAVSVRLA